MYERKVTLNFLVILCSSFFRGIIGRSFLGKLYAVASHVHLKITYHDMEGKSTIIITDLKEEKCIK